MSQRMDVHQAITGRIIEAIERGAGEFKLPWHRPAGSLTRPVNIQSGNANRGIDVVTLWASFTAWLDREASTATWARPEFQWRQVELIPS